jgi:ABC-type branched-subunit amino acid transport system ATPase component
MLAIARALMNRPRLAQYGYVLETGLAVMQGNAQDLLRDEGVKKAYLGI